MDEKENAVKVLKTKVTSASDDILTARKRLRVAVLEVTNCKFRGSLDDRCVANDMNCNLPPLNSL